MRNLRAFIAFNMELMFQFRYIHRVHNYTNLMKEETFINDFFTISLRLTCDMNNAITRNASKREMKMNRFLVNNYGELL